MYGIIDTGQPVWLVGTNRGTVSATAAAIAFGKSQLAGIVLTSSVTSIRKTGAVPYQKLEDITVPVLIIHHENDECKICVPEDVSSITRKLVNVPVRKEVFIKGGGNPNGDPCEALHWHGFIGMEQEVVNMISTWVKNPVP